MLLSPNRAPIDGRTLRKITRYRQELKKGSTQVGERLLPFQIAVRVDFLIEKGLRIEDIRKLRRPTKYDYDEDRMVDLLREMNEVCGFHTEAYSLAGVREQTLQAAGLVSS